jgi:hypothetical protein
LRHREFSHFAPIPADPGKNRSKTPPFFSQEAPLPGPFRRLFFFPIVLILAGAGCASTRPAPADYLSFQETVFEPVGVVDFRKDSLADYQALVQPGDLIVNYMRLGRAAKKREWLFALLPYGHSMLVVDPYDPQGLLECRFHGIRQVGPEELKLYSYNVVYRLRNAERLDVERLREFAAYGCTHPTRYNFLSWLGRNDNLFPELPEEISSRYTCSTMVAAAYHYAGVTLSASIPHNRVITPISLAASKGTFNEHARPADEPIASAPSDVVDEGHFSEATAFESVK